MFAPADKHPMEFRKSAARRALTPVCLDAIERCIAYNELEHGDPALESLVEAIADIDSEFPHFDLMLAYLLYDACTWVNTGMDQEPGVKDACLRYA